MDRETVNQAREEAEKAYTIYTNLQTASQKAGSEYFKKRERFQALDYELALTDGRFKAIPPGQKKEKKPAVLTLEQIQNIAEILGIKIEEEDEE